MWRRVDIVWTDVSENMLNIANSLHKFRIIKVLYESKYV
jgi:hypothetical protein